MCRHYHIHRLVEQLYFIPMSMTSTGSLSLQQEQLFTKESYITYRFDYIYTKANFLQQIY
ncbi:hypothetical protein NC652_000311 [Populus alba x Populus x berolinensis]|nr:hypothetical protein NC652_000311 [Populus alba x Populus x berolinensis]